MNRKTLTELDYYRIKETVAGYCVSEEGKNDILNREPFTEYSKYDFLKNLKIKIFTQKLAFFDTLCYDTDVN